MSRLRRRTARREIRGGRAPRRPQRLLYFAGPVDAVSVHRRWADGVEDERHFAIIYLRQFLQVVRRLGATARVYSARRAEGTVVDAANKVWLTYRPVPWHEAGAGLFVLGKLFAGVRLLLLTIRHRPDVVVATGAQTFWFMLLPLKLSRVRVVASLHNTLWSRHRPMPRLRRLLNPLDALLFRHVCEAILVVSDEIGDQVRAIAGPAAPVIRFLPSYPADAFEDIPPPDGHAPFEVAFVGRIDEAKGVYVLLAIAERLAALGETDVVFHLCGDGPALDDVRRQVQASGLEERVFCHGFLERDELKRMYGRVHAVIAPTTTDFVEGFNKVVLEGALAGRPVITSSACPALVDVHEAVIEVPPDDVRAYSDAVLSLRDDPALYASVRDGTGAVRERFAAQERSWEMTLLRVLDPDQS